MVSPAVSTLLTLLAILSGLAALVYAALRGIPARDFRPAVASLLAGFITANVTFIVRALGSLQTPTLVVIWAGGCAMLLTAFWHVLAPRSWHVVWDAFVALSRRLHPLGSVAFLITLLVTCALLLLRGLRALG